MHILRKARFYFMAITPRALVMIAIYDALRAAGLDHELAIVMNAQGLEGTPAIADVAVHVGGEGRSHEQ